MHRESRQPLPHLSLWARAELASWTSPGFFVSTKSKSSSKGEIEMARKRSKRLSFEPQKRGATLTLDFFMPSFWGDSIPFILWFTFSESPEIDSRPLFFTAVIQQRQNPHLLK